MKTITDIRVAFWRDHPQYVHLWRQQKRQNDYPTDVRVAFCDYVDLLASNGQITEDLAERVTL